MQNQNLVLAGKREQIPTRKEDSDLVGIMYPGLHNELNTSIPLTPQEYSDLLSGPTERGSAAELTLTLYDLLVDTARLGISEDVMKRRLNQYFQTAGKRLSDSVLPQAAGLESLLDVAYSRADVAGWSKQRCFELPGSVKANQKGFKKDYYYSTGEELKNAPNNVVYTIRRGNQALRITADYEYTKEVHDESGRYWLVRAQKRLFSMVVRPELKFFRKPTGTLRHGIKVSGLGRTSIEGLVLWYEDLKSGKGGELGDINRLAMDNLKAALFKDLDEAREHIEEMDFTAPQEEID